jgi:hypothetical protein
MLGSRGAPTLVGFVPNDHIFFSYKSGFFPNIFIWFLSMFLASIADPLELAFSFFPHMILASFLGVWKRRSSNPHQTNLSLSEGNPLDLDLRVIA